MVKLYNINKQLNHCFRVNGLLQLWVKSVGMLQLTSEDWNLTDSFFSSLKLSNLLIHLLSWTIIKGLLATCRYACTRSTALVLLLPHLQSYHCYCL